MAAADKTEFHMEMWLTKVVNSCTNIRQLIRAWRLVRFAERERLIGLDTVASVRIDYDIKLRLFSHESNSI